MEGRFVGREESIWKGVEVRNGVVREEIWERSVERWEEDSRG